MTSSEITPYEKLLENLIESISVILAEFCISIISNGLTGTNTTHFKNKIKECWQESVMANKLFFITDKTFEIIEVNPVNFLEFLQDEILVPIWSSPEPLSTEKLTELLKKLREVSNICN